MPADQAVDALDAVGTAQAVDRGELSPREATEAAIARIEARNPALNAVVATRFEQALAEVDAGLPAGPLRGVPFLVKALSAEIAGMPATSCSRLWADVVASADTQVVARYRSAGLVLLGLTNSPELGKNANTAPVLHGPTLNPWDRTRSAGGSSGGSAAAVASGMVPAAHGNDAGGSIRLPSAACGLFGLKPTRGRVSTAPMLHALTYPVGQTHALTTTVRDSAALLDAVCAPTPGEPYTIAPPARPYGEEVGRDPGRLRIGLTTTAWNGAEAHPECAEAARQAARLCEELGHRVTEVRPWGDLAAAQAAAVTVMGVSTASLVDARLEELGRPLRDDDLETLNALGYRRDREVTAVELHRALQQIERAGRVMAEAFADVDVLVTPTIASPVPSPTEFDAMRPETMAGAGRWNAFCSPFNLSGQPAMSVPLARDATGVPIGVQFAAPHGAEDVLVRLASQLEAAAPWPRTVPPA